MIHEHRRSVDIMEQAPVTTYPEMAVAFNGRTPSMAALALQ